MTDKSGASLTSLRATSLEDRRSAFVALFSDILARPSFLDSAVALPEHLLEEIGRDYTNRVNTLGGDLFYSGQLELYRSAMVAVFGNSEGSELRAMLFGFKPAVFSNYGQVFRSGVAELEGESSAELSAPLHLFKKHWLGDDFGIVQLPVLDRGLFDIAYSRGGISKVIAQHQDVLATAGFSPQDLGDPTRFMARFVGAYRPIVKSLVLGYSLASSLFFNLSVDAQCRPELGGMILEHAERFVSKEQYRFLEMVLEFPSILEGLEDLYLQSYTTAPSIHRAFDAIGLNEYIRDARHQRLGIIDFDDHV